MVSFYNSLHPYSRLGQMEALEGAFITERRLQLVSNNMANVNTTGFKKQGITFEEYYLEQVDASKRTAKGEIEKTDYRQGVAQETGNPLDLMLQGDGFFVIQTPQGERYTRAGNFTLNAQNQLVTNDGYPVLGNGAPIELPVDSWEGVWLSEDGRLFANGEEVGPIDLVDFPNPQGLDRMGQNLYMATEASGQSRPAEDVRLHQGFLEGSNVNPVEEMIYLIDLFRQYEAIQKSLQSEDQLDNQAANQLGRVG